MKECILPNNILFAMKALNKRTPFDNKNKAQK